MVLCKISRVLNEISPGSSACQSAHDLAWASANWRATSPLYCKISCSREYSASKSLSAHVPMNDGNIISFSPVIRVEQVREGFWRNQSPALDRG